MSEVFLELGGSNLERATGVAMEFRSAVTDIWLLPSLCMLHGPEIIRALSPLGFSRVVADHRIQGDDYTMTEAIHSAAESGVWGVTVAVDRPGAATSAANALDRLQAQGMNRNPPQLIGTLEPLPDNEAEWVSGRKTFETYGGFVRTIVAECKAAGFYGMRIRQQEAGLVEHAGLRAFVMARALKHRNSVAKDRGRKIPTPAQLLDLGITHPITNPIRLRCRDLDMASSLLHNEIRVWHEAKARAAFTPMRHIWGGPSILPEEPVQMLG